MMKSIKKWIPHSLLIRLYRYRWLFNLKKSDAIKVFGNGDKTILFVNHFYEQDLNALLNANSKFTFVVIRPDILFSSAVSIFDDQVKALDKPYLSESEKVKSTWRKECDWFFRYLTKQYGEIHLTVSPADDFYWYRELADVLRENHVPLVVVDKEGMISPNDFELESKRVRENAPPISDYFLVWSERQKEYWTKKGTRAENIYVTGQARSDFLYSLEKKFSADREVDVLLLSFDDVAYIPFRFVSDKCNWVKLKKDSHDAIYSLAQKFPNKNFVIKTHPQQPDFASLESQYTLPNLKVIGGSRDATELMMSSRAVVGFQTTSMFEMAAVGRSPLYLRPYQQERFLEEYLLPLHELKEAIIIESSEQLESELEASLTSNEVASNVKANDDAAAEYFHKIDGQRSSKILERLDQILTDTAAVTR